MKEGAIDLVSVSSSVPAGVAKKLETVKAGSRPGPTRSGRGPIVDQDGKTVLKAGETADDKFLHGINFYVQGCAGEIAVVQ